MVERLCPDCVLLEVFHSTRFHFPAQCLLQNTYEQSPCRPADLQTFCFALIIVQISCSLFTKWTRKNGIPFVSFTRTTLPPANVLMKHSKDIFEQTKADLLLQIATEVALAPVDDLEARTAERLHVYVARLCVITR